MKQNEYLITCKRSLYPAMFNIAPVEKIVATGADAEEAVKKVKEGIGFFELIDIKKI